MLVGLDVVLVNRNSSRGHEVADAFNVSFMSWTDLLQPQSPLDATPFEVNEILFTLFSFCG